ncbi:GNVR domain-containing protein [Thioclava sp. JE_KL1]|uniref:GNVR domain-containing protein n=1 Tax=Thioclava sp. JE_KL1 TaxID=2651187 RepID=UPI001562095A|nr:GNVR domain-containing protein [Thioclava sp. JE_KL1]
MRQTQFKFADTSNDLERPISKPPETVTLGQLTRILRRRRWSIIVPVVILGILGIIYLATTPRSYLANSLLLLDANISRSIEQLGASESNNLSESALEDARLIIRSDRISQSVVKELDLLDNPSFTSPPSSLFSRLIGGVINTIRTPINWLRSKPELSGTTTLTPEQITAARQDLAARALQARIDVGRVGRSSVISISYESYDPAMSAAIVNSLAEGYIADVLNANFEATERTTNWMQDRLTELQNQAQQAALDAETFRAEHGLVSSRGVSMTKDSVVQLNAEMANAVSDVARARARVDTYNQIIAGGVQALVDGGSTGVGGGSDPALQQARDTLTDSLAMLNQIKTNFGEDHPQYKVVERQVQAAAERLFTLLKQGSAQAKSDLSSAEAKVDALKNSLGLAIDSDTSSGTVEVQYSALQQRADTLSTLYQAFLTKFQEIEQQKSFPVSNVRILTKADVPRNPVGPSTKRALAISIVLGLIIGMMITAWQEWRERFLRTSDDVQDETGGPFLGYLPEFETSAQSEPVRSITSTAVFQNLRDGLAENISKPRNGSHSTSESAIYAVRHPRSFFAETLRSVRLAAEIRAPVETGAIVLGVTSARPEEGKSTVSLNLAAVLNMSNARVLLIDSDIRRPGLSQRLDFRHGDGLVEVLAGRAPWRNLVREVEGTGVHILPCIPPNGFTHSAELLSSRGMRELIAEVRSEFDFVIIDLAPLGAIVDARAMIPNLDTVLLVASWGKTPKLMLNRILSANAALRERLLGTVLNRVDMEDLRDFVDVSSTEAYFEDYNGYFGDPGKSWDKPEMRGTNTNTRNN